MAYRSLEPLAGKKTYLAAAALVAYAVGGYALGYVEPVTAVEFVLQAAAIVGLRLGISKAE
jgi:hypothetical protein